MTLLAFACFILSQKQCRLDSICFHYPCHSNHQKGVRVGKEALRAFTCPFLTGKATFSHAFISLPLCSCLTHMWSQGERSRVKNCIKFHGYKKEKKMMSNIFKWKLNRLVFKERERKRNSHPQILWKLC